MVLISQIKRDESGRIEERPTESAHLFLSLFLTVSLISPFRLGLSGARSFGFVRKNGPIVKSPTRAAAITSPHSASIATAIPLTTVRRAALKISSSDTPLCSRTTITFCGCLGGENALFSASICSSRRACVGIREPPSQHSQPLPCPAQGCFPCHEMKLFRRGVEGANM